MERNSEGASERREAPVDSPAGPFHVAVIMDGNGRWASRRGLPRSAGHRQGARGLQALLECAGELGVGVLTLYAFSSDNWRRPRAEVTGLMRLFGAYLDREAERCRERGMRLQVIGRRDRLPAGLVASIQRAEAVTRRQRRLLVRVAIDYSSRWAIGQAARGLADLGRPSDSAAAGPDFRRALARAIHSDAVSDPDLVIRTGGEQRLSDFLLWESAYAELAFSPSLFPDFSADELRDLVAQFRGRQRRFGGVPHDGVPHDEEPQREANGGSVLAHPPGEARRAGAHPGEVLAGPVETG